MRPSTVIFDMDDVLCRYDLGKRLRALSRATGRTPRDIRAAIWDSGFEDASDAGGYPDAEDYLAEFGKRLGCEIDRGVWIEARRNAMTPWPDMLALARRIGETARIAIFSNNGPLTKSALPLLFPEVTEIFPEHFFSFEFATKKPDPESFLRLAARMGVAPSDCWFIDDKRSNVQGARIAGFPGHHFRSVDPFVDDARARGFDL
ncbi:MAG: HAD family phosphatase [Hyphomicrobiales bacterium]